MVTHLVVNVVQVSFLELEVLTVQGYVAFFPADEASYLQIRVVSFVFYRILYFVINTLCTNVILK